ncbi:MAG TPA: protein kinase [Terracidiphilus sp.]|jgi:serine/threonine-protein kinase
MTPELWERLNPLFNAVVERPAPERQAFIAKVCADDIELLRELTALVDAHEAEGSATGEIVVKINDVVVAAMRGRLNPSDVVEGRFEIVRHLGSGGMGDVYEARDEELSQNVALKMIRPEIAENEAILSRFRKEVQLARRLSGPNVCRIHELFVLKGDKGETSGAFLTMELLEGTTLAEKVQGGPVPWKEAELIAMDICAGLGTMHKAGIIHRDLKSRNIMLAERDGRTRAVLMDFGLARELSQPAATAEAGVTVPGAVLGTPEYMAPEQFEGRAATPATDIYAVGIALYELVTGQHPFASTHALGAAVLRGRKPASASTVVHGLPRRWDVVIRKCLEYDASRRYQSSDELAKALRSNGMGFKTWHWRPSQSAAMGLGLLVLAICMWFVPTARERLEGLVLSNHDKHIVVLPFDVGKDNPESAVLADGLMDSLTGKLTSLGSENQTLWVVPASEVRRRKVTDPLTALREFGATMVVKGQFRRDGQVVHLNLELIDVKKMREIGFADVENPEQDLSALQDDAVQRLGRLMNISIKEELVHGGEEGVSASAYAAYIAALGYLERYDKPGNLDAAIRSLTHAAQLSPRFALALGELGQAYILKYRVDANPDSLKVARDFCTRAIAVDDRIPALYTALATLDGFSGKDDLAAAEYQHVIDLAPRNVEAYRGLAMLYEHQGRHAEAEKAYVRAAELRPDDWNGYNLLANFLDTIGRHKEAIEQLQHAMKLAPDNAYIYCNLGGAYVNSGEPALLPEAEKAYERSIALNPTYQAYTGLGDLYARERRFAESAVANEKAVALDDQDYEVWNNLSQAYDGMGDGKKAEAARKQAIKRAERAVTLNPTNAWAHATLAELSAKENMRDAVSGHIHTALALDAKDQYVLSEVAAAYEVEGDRKQAVKYLELALLNGFPPSGLNGDVVLKRVSSDPHFRISGK